MLNEQSRLFPDTEKEIDLVCQSLKLQEANVLAFKIISLVDAHCSKIQVVGSVRRQRDIVRDIDFVVISDDKNWRNIGNELVLMDNAVLKMKGDKIRRFLVPFERGQVQADFYRAKPETWGIQTLVRTGSADHNIWLAKHAIKHGMRLQYSIGLVTNGHAILGATEEEIFKELELPYIVPPQREMKGANPIWKK